jgi:superfamily II DNA or RNA helicase
MNFRPYQTDAIQLLRAGFAQHKRQVLCLPTGAGKTIIFSEIVRLAAEKKTTTLILTDRIELFSQTFKAIQSTGITPYQIHAANKARIHDTALVYVGMVETVARRELTFTPSLIIIDEAHKGNFNKVIDAYPDAKIIGATATPTGKHFFKYYTNIVNNIDIPELISQRYLSPCKAFQMQDDFSDLQVKAGEFTEQSLFNHFDKKNLYSGVVDEYLQRCEGKKTLVFNVNIEHAQNMNIEFNERGVRSEVITSKTSKHERERILLAFKQGLFPVLNNCGILTTGYDEPSIECVIMNRATTSVALWLQCCGRGSRIYPGKEFFTVLDFGMNHNRLGMWNEPREWKLKPEKKKREGIAPVKKCPECDAMLAASIMFCPYCQHEFKVTEKDFKTGVMVEILPHVPTALKGKRISDLSIDELIELEKAKKYKATFIWRVLRSMGEDALSRYAQKRGYKSGWVYNQKKQILQSNYHNYIL